MSNSGSKIPVASIKLPVQNERDPHGCLVTYKQHILQLGVMLQKSISIGIAAYIICRNNRKRERLPKHLYNWNIFLFPYSITIKNNPICEINNSADCNAYPNNKILRITIRSNLQLNLSAYCLRKILRCQNFREFKSLFMDYLTMQINHCKFYQSLAKSKTQSHIFFTADFNHYLSSSHCAGIRNTVSFHKNRFVHQFIDNNRNSCRCQFQTCGNLFARHRACFMQQPQNGASIRYLNVSHICSTQHAL